MNKYLFRNKGRVISYIIVCILAHITTMLMFNAYGIITEIVEKNQRNRIPNLIVLVVAIMVSLALMVVYMNVVIRNIQKKIIIDLRKDIFDKVYSLDYKKFLEKDSTYYVSMITNDVNMLEENYFEKILDMANSIIAIIVTLVTIFTIGWQYGLVSTVLLLILVSQSLIMKTRVHQLRKGGES